MIKGGYFTMNMINKSLALVLVGLLSGSFMFAMDKAPVVPMTEVSSVGKSAVFYKENRFETDSPTTVSADGKKMVYLSNKGKSFGLLVDSETEGFVEKAFDGNGCTYTCVTMSPDGKMVVAATKECLLFLTITDIDKMDFSAVEFPNNIKKLIFSADSKRLVTLDESSAMKIFDIKNIHEITGKNLITAGQKVSDFVMNSDGSKVIAIADKKVIVCSIKVSNSQEIHIAKNFFSGEDSFKGIAIESNGECFIVWDSADKMQICTFDSVSDNINTYFMKNKYQKNISSVVFSPDGKYIASLGRNGFVLWGKEKANCLVSGLLDDFSQTMSSGVIVFSHDGKKFLLCDNDQLFCFDVNALVTNKAGNLDPEFVIDIEDKDIELSKLYFDSDNGKIIISGSPVIVIDIEKNDKKSKASSVVQKTATSSDKLRDVDRVLLLACKNGKSLDFALTHGANPNIFDEKFTDVFGKPCLLTPLQLACFFGNKSNVISLLKAGAYVNELSQGERYSSLYLAIGNLADSDEKKKERCEIVQILLQHKANVGFMEDCFGKTILFQAIEVRNMPLVDILLNVEGTNLHAVTHYGFNVLTMAIAPDAEVDLLCKLFDLGVRPIVDKNGASLMHHAVLAQNPKAIKELVARGFNINAVNNKQYTPLHVAAGFANAETVEALILSGADPRKVNNAGKTPLGLHLSLPKSSQKGDVLAILRSAKKPKKLVVQKEPKEKVNTVQSHQTSASKEQSTSDSSKKNNPAKEEQQQKKSIKIHEPKENQSPKEESNVPTTASVEQKQVTEKNNDAAEQKKESEKEKPSLTKKILATASAVVSILKPEQRQETFLKMGTTYAAAVHPSARRIEDPIKKKTIYFQDTYLEICIPDVWKKRNKNPIVNVRKSQHVEETSARPNDYFHNFSRLVHKKLGKYVDAENFVDPNYKHYIGTRYTLPGTVTLPSYGENSWGKEVCGTFEFVVVKDTKRNDCKLIHSFFNPKA